MNKLLFSQPRISLFIIEKKMVNINFDESCHNIIVVTKFLDLIISFPPAKNKAIIANDYQLYKSHPGGKIEKNVHSKWSRSASSSLILPVVQDLFLEW